MIIEYHHTEGTQIEKPATIEFSPSVVYLRKDIEKIGREDFVTGKIVPVWSYNEAVLSHSDYAIYAAEQAQANVEYVACMADIDLDV